MTSNVAELLRDNPDLVSNYRTALLAFWKKIAGDPSEADAVALLEEIVSAQLSAMIAGDEDRMVRLGHQLRGLRELGRVRFVVNEHELLMKLGTATVEFLLTLPLKG